MGENIIELNENTFTSEVTESKGAVLVDFWASWCMPCLALAPTLEKIAEELKGKLKVCKVNIDENNRIASQFGVMSIPTMIIFKDGKEEDRMVGALGSADIKRRVEKHLE
ncbi:thioredoxin [Candidatus Omnitrophota bacterium]